MNRLNYITTILISILFFTNCSHEHIHEDDVHEHAGISVTQYTDATEIFMEYPSLVVNQEAEFLIHLTDLKNFKAVTEGLLKITFSNGTDEILSYTEEKPVRPGIYIPAVKFTKPGNYIMQMELKGNQVSDIITVNNVIVYSNFGEVPHLSEDESSDIPFLKEQQWKIKFANEKVMKREMQKSVAAVGEIIAKQENYSKVTSPVAGIILKTKNNTIRSVGTYIRKGEILINISPSIDQPNNFQIIKNEYVLAKSDYERARKLFEKKAISSRRLEESKLKFESKHVIFNTLTEQIKLSDAGYSLISPINGYIEQINFNFGESFNPGKELFTIVNPKRLILKTNVPSSQIEAALNTKDASFIIDGISRQFKISELNGQKTSVGAGMDESNRTIPVYFEFNNPDNILKIGMFADVRLKLGDKKEFIAIPESAIINEDGLHTAYVQLEGEAFEKRILETGIIDNGFIQILNGINLGERVVIEGAYQVRLSALSPESAIGHGHAH